MKVTDRAASKKEPYEAPVIRRIRLIADELAVGACKRIRVATDVCNKTGTFINRTIGS